MMIMDFRCRLFGNLVCKTLQCSSNFLTCYYQMISCCNSNGLVHVEITFTTIPCPHYITIEGLYSIFIFFTTLSIKQDP